jgi:aspartate carbamoyltransferase regulatory subunit
MESIIDTQTLTNFINESNSSANVNSPSIHISSGHQSSSVINIEDAEFTISERNTLFFNIPSSTVTIAQSNYKVSKWIMKMIVYAESTIQCCWLPCHLSLIKFRYIIT